MNLRKDPAHIDTGMSWASVADVYQGTDVLWGRRGTLLAWLRLRLLSTPRLSRGEVVVERLVSHLTSDTLQDESNRPLVLVSLKGNSLLEYLM